jgi:magnesium transporter
MAHALFTPEVKYLLAENDAAGLKDFCESLHPATVAEALVADLPVDHVWQVLKHTDIAHQAAIFEYFPLESQIQMVEGTGREHMAKLIQAMSHDDRGDLVRRLAPKVSESLLRLVDEADRKDIATLVRQVENTAGALMTTDYAWLPPNLAASEALDRLRLQAPHSETIYYIFILDDGHRLVGVLSLRNLILAPRHALVRDIMEGKVVSVRASDDRDKVAKTIAQYDLLAVPVVDDDHGRMVGIITYDDIIDVVVEEATEDVHRMGAVGPLAENYLTANFVTVWRKRAFWLACLFIAELFTFTALSHFDEAINSVVVLALFVPLCISTGGNSGSQAATLITRAMALGQVTLSDWLKVLRHEIAMGIVLGLTLGFIGFVRGSATPEDIRGNIIKRDKEFHVKVPIEHNGDVKEREENHAPTWWAWVFGPTEKRLRVQFPQGCVDESILEKKMEVILPANTKWEVTDAVEGDRLHVDEKGQRKYKVYHIPEKSEVRSDAVNRWLLAVVIAQAVAIICLWGTLVGSMLPLIFRRMGVDPGIASSPFVATFVDVTGIVIYFSIASIYLL